MRACSELDSLQLCGHGPPELEGQDYPCGDISICHLNSSQRDECGKKALLGLLQQLHVLDWTQPSTGREGKVPSQTLPAVKAVLGAFLRKALRSWVRQPEWKSLHRRFVSSLTFLDVSALLCQYQNSSFPKTTSEPPDQVPCIHPSWNQIITRKPPMIPQCRESR